MERTWVSAWESGWDWGVAEMWVGDMVEFGVRWEVTGVGVGGMLVSG